MCLEEEGPQGKTDSSPVTLYDLCVLLEKRGVMDFKVTGHEVDRPADVKRGESADRVDVKHVAFSVYKPNPVQVKHVKASNLAGFINFTKLSESKYLQLVWRALASI